MVGHERFNTAKILEAPVTLKVRELFDIAPIVRRQIANEMKSSEPRRRPERQVQAEPATVVNREVVSEPAVTRTVPKHKVIPECLYITAWINGRALPRTLVDSGAVVDLISPRAVQKAELRPRPIQEEPWGIRLASDDLVEIKECVDIQVNVAGVEMPITAYVTGIGVTYDLLLSRRWMEGIGAQEDYKSRTFTIDHGGTRRMVKPTPTNILKAEEPLDQEPGLDPGPGRGANTQEELEEEMAEDAIDELEREMDMFLEDTRKDQRGKE